MIRREPETAIVEARSDIGDDRHPAIGRRAVLAQQMTLVGDDVRRAGIAREIRRRTEQPIGIP